MLSSRVIARAPQLVAAQTRNIGAVISGPPTVRVSFAEKMAHAAAIAVGILAGPCWVLTHLKSYKGEQ